MAKKEIAKKAAVVKANTSEDKKTALDGAIKQIEKKYEFFEFLDKLLHL